MNTQRVALITGSTSGIGLAIAKQLVTDGFAVAFHSNSSVETGKELANSYPNSSYTQANLADQNQVLHLINEVLSKHERLDVLVNNAAITRTIPHSNLKEATPEIWREIYEVNVIAPW